MSRLGRRMTMSPWAFFTYWRRYSFRKSWFSDDLGTFERVRRSWWTRHPWVRFLLWLLGGLAIYGLQVALLVSLGWAHPGRLDVKGCHHVTKPWRTPLGETVYDEYHCHRPLGQTRLGDRDRVEPDEAGEEMEPRPSEGAP